MRVKYQRAPITTEWTVGADGQHRRRHPGRREARRRTGPHGGRLVGPDGPAGRRAVVRAVRAQLARLDHRQHGGQAVHERVDALRRGRATTCTAASTARAPGPARTCRPGWSSTSSTATATSSRDCNRDNVFRRSGWSPASSSRPTRSRSWPQKTGLPADALTATVERFNGFARSGVDEDFHRGESAYDRYYGDPTNKPNPNLGEISHAPFYAAKMVPGDLGTKGGVRTDVHGRALRDDGSVIEGLYAAGNVSAPVMGHTYPGPGGTIGPAMTFGYLAALHIAGARQTPDARSTLDGRAGGAELPDPPNSPGPVATCSSTTSASARAPTRWTRANCATSTDDTPQVLPTFGNVAPTFHDDRAADGALPRHRHRAGARSCTPARR